MRLILPEKLDHPIGVAAPITPGNTPFLLETWKGAPWLAAGDTGVLKPVEWAIYAVSKSTLSQ